MTVSNAGFHEFSTQVADVIQFLTEWGSEIRRLVEFPGVTGVIIDFGIAWRDVAAQSDEFPAELVRQASACGIGLMLSHYPIRDAEH